MPYLLVLLLPVWLFAMPLQSLLDQEPHRLKARNAALYSSYLQNEGILDKNFEIEGGITYADSDRNGVEEEVSFSFDVLSQDFDWYVKKSHDLMRIKQEIAKNQIKLSIWRVYAKACALQKQEQLFKALERKSKELLNYIDRLIEAGEMAQKRSYYFKAQYYRLQVSLKELQDKIERSRAKIASLVAFDGRFECPVAMPSIDGESLRLKMLDQKINSLRQYSKTFTPYKRIRASIGYERELDTKRVRAGLVLPLGLSKGYEAKRRSIRAKIDASLHEKIALKNAQKADFKALKNRLKILRPMKIDLNDAFFQKAIKRGEATLVDSLEAMAAKIEMQLEQSRLSLQRIEMIFDYAMRYAIKESK